ncbi:hypothetical protein CC80DRAFT_589111 [Byssothecium circinans]|uniref:Uncharacterized protein n=1 Tax=Byssothecium circinans TaxID=147558 RepID=A0A6A5UC86_9PLEO|nr:hypothetical protein CC80DRAFT_589111 [Byssothecium circinans]
MRFIAFITFLISSVGALAVAVTRDNICFDPKKGVCMGYNADAVNATLAIKDACAKVPRCTPGGIADRPRVTGKVKGFPYTATLGVGNQCGGVTSWSVDACVGLFNQFVDDRCELQYPAGADKYQLGYETSTCDGSFVSFNFGG